MAQQQRKYVTEGHGLSLEIIRVKGKWWVEWGVSGSPKSIATRNRWTRYSKYFREPDNSFKPEALARKTIVAFLDRLLSSS